MWCGWDEGKRTLINNEVYACSGTTVRHEKQIKMVYSSDVNC